MPVQQQSNMTLLGRKYHNILKGNHWLPFLDQYQGLHWAVWKVPSLIHSTTKQTKTRDAIYQNNLSQKVNQKDSFWELWLKRAHFETERNFMQLYCFVTHKEIQLGTHPHFPWKIQKKKWTHRKIIDLILCLSNGKKKKCFILQNYQIGQASHKP